jgi:nicotinamidase-related amidase
MGRLVDVDDSVLVVIDTQPGFLDKLPSDEAQGVEDRIRWLVRVAGELEVPIVVTEEEAEDNGPTSSAIRDVLPDGDPGYPKPVFGVAANPEILTDLDRLGRRTAVLCGLETDVCVLQSALGLLDHGWRVVVVRDAVGAPGTAHEQGLARMREAGADLIGSKGLSYEWVRTVEGARRLHRALDGDEPKDITL